MKGWFHLDDLAEVRTADRLVTVGAAEEFDPHALDGVDGVVVMDQGQVVAVVASEEVMEQV
jgi:hypothetical protein